MSETLRSFFALPVRDEDQRKLTAAQARMQRAAEGSRLGIRWTTAEQLHVTLKFLGSIGAEHLPELSRLGRECAAAASAVSTTFSDVIAFGGARRARVLVVALDDPDATLSRLAACVEAGVESLGVARETRSFVPHVTLARIKRPGDASSVLSAARLEPAPAHFDELRLYRSELTPRGSVYTVLDSWRLGAD